MKDNRGDVSCVFKEFFIQVLVSFHFKASAMFLISISGSLHYMSCTAVYKYIE